MSRNNVIKGQFQERFSVERKDFNSKIFEIVLQYMYTGEVNLSHENVLSLFVMSSDLGIPCLKKLCENYMIYHVDTVNAPLLLQMSNEYDSVIVRAKVNQFIDHNIKRILQSTELVKMKTNTLIHIISRNQLKLNNDEEILIFEAVERWFNNDRNTRVEPLKTIIQHIRYPLMTSEQLVKVEASGLVPQHPLLFDAYKYHIVKGTTSDSNKNCPRYKPRNQNQS
jgi:hypothetical protein